MQATNIKTLLILFLFVPAILLVTELNKSKRYGIPNTHVVPIDNSETGAEYELYIKLPKDYEKNKQVTYPVIYITDAVWSIEILSAATEYQMKNVILVGISWQKDMSTELKKVGEYASRNRDYTIKEVSDPETQAKYQLGNAEQHLNFIRNNVITYVEKHYRTQSKNRSFFGYSLGGQFGAYILLKQPNTFKNYIIGSPEISDETAEFKELVVHSPQNLNANVFISYGSLETELGKHTETMIDQLKAKNDASLSVTPAIIEGNHSTAFPLTGVHSVTWLANLLKEKD